MQRHAGGGNAVRAVACLPALVGAWRDPAGGALLSSSGTYPVDTRGARAARPHPRHAAHDQHERRSAMRCSTRRDPPIRAIYVYNSNPVAVAPESAKVARGLRARGSLLRRARDLPDRHRRLRRHPAAGDDAARAARRPHVRTATCTRSPTIRRSRRSARRCRTPRCSAGWRRGWASPSPAFATPTTTSRGRRSGATIRAPRARLGRR